MAFFFNKKQGDSPKPGLDSGWQFYSKPTALDPPGTIFRIDPAGVRYAVDELKIKTNEGIEAGGKSLHSAQTKVSIIARFLDMDFLGAEAKGDQLHKLEFEIKEPILERTTDSAVKKVLEPYLKVFEFKKGHRYFLIREARSASSMTYRLTQGQLAELGGKGAIAENIGTSAVVGSQKDGLQEFDQVFPQRLRVMFLPEEITELGAGLGGAGPKLGLVPVNELLEWREPTVQ